MHNTLTFGGHLSTEAAEHLIAAIADMPREVARCLQFETGDTTWPANEGAQPALLQALNEAGSLPSTVTVSLYDNDWEDAGYDFQHLTEALRRHGLAYRYESRWGQDYDTGRMESAAIAYYDPRQEQHHEVELDTDGVALMRFATGDWNDPDAMYAEALRLVNIPHFEPLPLSGPGCEQSEFAPEMDDEPT